MIDRVYPDDLIARSGATEENVRASLAMHDQTITVICQNVEAQRAAFSAMGLPLDRLRLIPDPSPDGAGR